MADSDITIVGLQAVGSVGQVVLQWAVNDPNISGLPYLLFDHVEIRRANAASMDGADTINDNASTAFADTSVIRASTWFYQVRAINRSEQAGEWSSVVSATETSDNLLNGDSVIGTDGYWIQPSGFIHQWGVGLTHASTGIGTINYNIPFTAVFGFDIFPFEFNFTVGYSVCQPKIASTSLTQVVFTIDRWRQDNLIDLTAGIWEMAKNTSFRWQAIGR